MKESRVDTSTITLEIGGTFVRKATITIRSDGANECALDLADPRGALRLQSAAAADELIGTVSRARELLDEAEKKLALREAAGAN